LSFPVARIDAKRVGSVRDNARNFAIRCGVCGGRPNVSDDSTAVKAAEAVMMAPGM
jgi:hypothetical protein